MNEFIINNGMGSSLLIEQLKKITTFVYILIFLFILNIIFNLNFQWEGISIIVNVYLYVFSFYMIFNFSLIDVHAIKEEFREKYPRFGDHILFLKTRVVPFLIIYFITIVYTLINYLNKDYWPMQPILELLDGRFSNIVFYSLILLIILRLNKRPRITIPLFVAGAVVYFLIYQLVFFLIPKIEFGYITKGALMSGSKFFQLTIAFMFLIYEFVNERKKMLKSFLSSMLVGLFIYLSFVGISSLFYGFSTFASYSQTKSSQILMKLGYAFPLKNFKSIVIETSDPLLLYDLIYYSNEYKQELVLTGNEWENLMLSSSIEVANIIAYYILDRNITLSYNQIFSYAERRSIDSGERLINSLFYIKYASRYCEDNFEDIIKRFEKGNDSYKIWTSRVFAESKFIRAVPTLINMLTDINDELSQDAYSSLTRITGLDPVKDLKVKRNSPEAIVKFAEFYRNYYNKN